jgi:hypothetical protein
MFSQLPLAGLRANALSTSQSMSTALAQLTAWQNGAVMQDGCNLAGDPSVVPDVANSRLKLQSAGAGMPGQGMPYTYLVGFSIAGVGGGTNDMLLQIRKSVAGTMTVQPDLSTEMGISTSRSNCTMLGVLVVNPGDQSLATFADPPAGSFGGQGGAPKVETWIDIAVKVLAGGPTNFTLEYGQFWALRLN